MPAKTPKHSPLPWRLNENGHIEGLRRNPTREEYLADQALIVRAVNSHDAMAKALKAVRADSIGWRGYHEVFRAEIDAALKLAEEA